MINLARTVFDNNLNILYGVEENPVFSLETLNLPFVNFGTCFSAFNKCGIQRRQIF
jgi:hypothetical protein